MAYALKPDEARGANPFGPPYMHRLEHFLVFYALGRMAVSIYLVLGGSCLHIYTTFARLEAFKNLYQLNRTCFFCCRSKLIQYYITVPEFCLDVAKTPVVQFLFI